MYKKYITLYSLYTYKSVFNKDLGKGGAKPTMLDLTNVLL